MGVAWHRFLAFVNIWTKRARGRPDLAGRAAADHGRRPADRLRADRGPRRGRRARRRQGRGLHLEGAARLHHLHRVRPLPVAVPGLEHRQAAVARSCWSWALRDHAYAKAPVAAGRRGGPRTRWRRSRRESEAAARRSASLVGAHRVRCRYGRLAAATAYNPHGARSGAVIDQDVLWSCTTCGACVEQCPVDIEHVDAHRRHAPLPGAHRVGVPRTSSSGLFKNLEKNAQPVGHGRRGCGWTGPRTCRSRCGSASGRGRRVADRGRLPVLGRLRRRATRTGRRRPPARWPSCSHTAGRVVRGARRRRGAAPATRPAAPATSSCSRCSPQQNVETLNEAGATKIVVTCAHCFNTLKNEYPQVGGSYEVVHHTQLLNRLVRDKRLVPGVAPGRRPIVAGCRLDRADA